jgi:hypothetical protein
MSEQNVPRCFYCSSTAEMIPDMSRIPRIQVTPPSTEQIDVQITTVNKSAEQPQDI